MFSETKMTAELSSVHCHLQTKCQLVQTSYIKSLNLLFCLYGKIWTLVVRRDLTASVCLLHSVCTHDLGQDSPIQTSCLVIQPCLMRTGNFQIHNYERALNVLIQPVSRPVKLHNICRRKIYNKQKGLFLAVNTVKYRNVKKT